MWQNLMIFEKVMLIDQSICMNQAVEIFVKLSADVSLIGNRPNYTDFGFGIWKVFLWQCTKKILYAQTTHKEV